MRDCWKSKAILAFCAFPAYAWPAMSTTPATPGPYSAASIPASTPVSQPPGLAEAFTDEQLQSAIDAAWEAVKDDPEKSAVYEARAFLAALPAQPGHCVEADQKAQPWTLPAPPPGRRWHREDWTADMLPDGYRPLLEGEAWLRGDEIRRTRSTRWDVAGQIGFDVIGEPATKKTSHCRTRRPLPAEASAEPEQVQAADGPQAASKADEPAPAKSGHGWPYDDLLKSMDRPEPAQPWTPKPGDVVRLKSGGPEMTVTIARIPHIVECSWFDLNGHNHFTFLIDCLTPAKEGQP
jgi:uncharacterized protein YodC (DUF2158 family)